jgi:hypothetical protein
VCWVSNPMCIRRVRRWSHVGVYWMVSLIVMTSIRIAGVVVGDRPGRGMRLASD